MGLLRKMAPATERKITAEAICRFVQEMAEKLPMLQECRLATLASSAKVIKKSVAAVQILPIMMPTTSSTAMLRTCRANKSTKPVTSMEPRNAAPIMPQKGTAEPNRRPNTITTPTSSFAPLEMPST